MTDNQSGAMEAGWSLEKEVSQKVGEQIVHTWLSVDVPEDPSDINVGEQEVTQSSEPIEKEWHLNNLDGHKKFESQIQSMPTQLL